MIPTFHEIKELKIDFHTVKYGWIDFTLTLGDKSFETSFSHVFDPILNLKEWLESICKGAQQSSFVFDREGFEIKFSLERISDGKEVFTVTKLLDNPETFLCGYVDRHQLIKEFYFGLLDFRNSPNFNKDDWEIEYMWERLTEMLEIDYELLLHALSELNRDELKKILFRADPSYYVSFPKAKDKKEEMRLFIETSVEGKELPSDHTKVETPAEWHVPEDFDSWTAKRKKEFVKECLSERTEGYTGTNIKDFKSKIIEDFLNSRHIL